MGVGLGAASIREVPAAGAVSVARRGVEFGSGRDQLTRYRE